MAQGPRFYLGFDHILDNREYFTDYGVHQTFFGARINPGVSFGFDTVHSIGVGINYMYEFGGELLGVTPQIDLFYSYQAEHLKAKFGSFRRKEVMEYPLMLMTDSIEYFRPNVEGASIGYQWEWGSAHTWVDWMGRATEETREAIHAGIDATLNFKMFFLSAISTRYHLSKTASATDSSEIRDDGSIFVLAGLDLSEEVFLDRLSIGSGMANTYRRDRPSFTQWFNGWYSQVDVAYRFFGFRGSYYLGDPSVLALGDPLYASGNYGRIDLYVDPFRNPRISSKIGWSFHFLPGEGLFHSQQILISVSL
jgi:hypothetical protein